MGLISKMMRHQRYIVTGVLISLLGFVGPLAMAQENCPYATIELDTAMAVDDGLICQAAQPLAEDGARILVYLTDFQPADETAWFAHLDQVEADAGLRDLNQPDSFARDGLSFEFSTAANLAWGQTVTFGESFDGSALDTDSSLIPTIKNDIRLAIASGEPGQGFARGLEAAYVALNPPPSPIRWLVWGVVGLAGMGVAGFAVAWAARPMLARRKEAAALQAHLESLRSRTNNLLSASDRLLEGSEPTETVLYQLFSAYGGEADEALQTEIHEWLRRSQAALRDAFDLRRKLDDPTAQARPLPEQVRDWETLYLTLTGNSERILTLTDEELRTLLDPLLTLEREATDDAQLASQLDEIRRNLAGMPLKIALRMVDPASTDAEGILGYLDRVQGQIAYLRQVHREAPQHLAEAQTERQTLAQDLPADFLLDEAQLFAVIDQQLKAAEQSLDQDKAVSAWELVQAARADLAVVSHLYETYATYQTEWAKVAAIQQAGFKPPDLGETSQEIAADLTNIKSKISEGDYQRAMPLIEELKIDYERALSLSERWQALAEKNQTVLDQLGQKLSELQQFDQAEVQEAWQRLQAYAEANWADFGPLLTQAQQTLAELKPKLEQAATANSLTTQRFDQAELMLDQAQNDIDQAEQDLRAIVHRLAEVQAAEQHWASTLAAAQADLAQAEAFRDQEDRKISDQVDDQLRQARTQLAAGETQGQQQYYLAAMDSLAEARSTITVAYTRASEQVAQINQAQFDLQTIASDAVSQAGALQSTADQRSAAGRTAKTSALMRQALAALSTAKQAQIISADLEDIAWLNALHQAIDQFEQASQQLAEAKSSLAADLAQIEQLREQASQAIAQATAAIEAAEAVVNHRDAGNVGLKTLQQARRLLPERRPADDLPLPSLQRLVSAAQEAAEYAGQAEELAHKQIAFVQDRRRQRDLITWTSTMGQGGFGRPSGSGMSFPQRPPVWGRPRSSGGRSRPSPRPPSIPRSSSMGRSRRR